MMIIIIIVLRQVTITCAPVFMSKTDVVSFCPCVCVFVYLFVCLSVCLCVRVSVCLCAKKN